VPDTFVLPAGPASPAAARARPQPPPRARRTPRPRQCQVRRACREAGPPPGVAELNCSGLGGPVGVPDRVRNTKLTYPIPPRISPRHAAPADGRPASRTPGAPPRAGGDRARKRPDRWAPEVSVGASVTECSIWPIPRESFDKRATQQNGGSLRGRAKTQVALRNGLPRQRPSSAGTVHAPRANPRFCAAARATARGHEAYREGGFGLARHLQPGACSRDRACLASRVKFEQVSYRRVLPFALPDVTGSAGLMIGPGPGAGAELVLVRW